MNGTDNEINGPTKLNADLTILGNLLVTGGATISPTEISYLDGGTQNINTALTTLQSKTANITTAGSITIPAGQSIVGVSKAMVGLNFVNNTADMNKPVSIAQSTAILLKVDKSNANFTGNLQVENYITAKRITCSDIGTFTNGIYTSIDALSHIRGELIIWGEGTFPTAPSTSKGTSVYFIPVTGATGFLNRSQAGEGGFQFYNITHTTTPKLLANISSVGTLTLPQHINAVNGVFSGNVSTVNLIADSINNSVAGFKTYSTFEKGSVQVSQSENSNQFVVIAATIITTPNTKRKMSISTPISVLLTWNGQQVNGVSLFTHLVTDVTCEILKNGVKIMDVVPILNRALPFNDNFISTGSGSSADFYLCQATSNFTLLAEAGTNTYSVRYTFTKVSVNCIDKNFSTNKIISNQNLFRCTRYASSVQATGYIPYNYNEELVSNITDGTVEMNDVYIDGNIKSNSISGAIMITPAQHSILIYRSVPLFNDYYNDSTGPIDVGNRTVYSYEDYDWFYIINPGYRLVIYDDRNYSGVIRLDYTNNTTKPQSIQPNVIQKASSCRLYFHGVQI